MKHRWLSILMLPCLLLSACSFLIKNEQVYITPHSDNLQNNADEIVSVDTYLQMRQVLVSRIESGTANLIISVSSFDDESADYYAKTAIDHALQDTPIGTYAVNHISYEVGKNQGKPVIAFHMDYRHGVGDIMRIKTVENMEEAVPHIETALTEYADSLVFQVKNYSKTDIAQRVADYGNLHPDQVMEQPQVRVSVYPNSGEHRVVEIFFTYQNSHTDLQKMQKIVADVFASAQIYVQQTNVKERFSRLYSFLMERDEYTIESSITPAYSLLHYGVGDSRALANVYAAMCRSVELDCKVISGTRDGKPWFWNIVGHNGKYYHVDLLRCNESGGFQMLTDKEMKDYVWDYSAY